MDPYSSESMWFLIVTFIVILLIAGLAAANIYYWNQIRTNQTVSTTVGLTLLVLNSIAAAALVIIAFWIIYCFIQSSTRPMHYPGMNAGPIMTMSSPIYNLPSPHYL